MSPKKVRTPPDIDCPPYFLPLHSLEDNYRVISDLGNGSFGNVTLAKSNFRLDDSSKFRQFHDTLLDRKGDFIYENLMNKKSGLVAIKTMNKRLERLNDYLKVKEVKFILAIPYHKNLVQMYEMFLDDVNFKLHIVMEVMDRNLYQLMKGRKNNRFSQTTLKSILAQVLNGIRHIHRNGYFHRDVKPENILVSPSNRFYEEDYIYSGVLKFHDNFIVKIADYGLARHVDNRRPYTSYVSTRWYRAPEILLRKNWYSRPVDIWAFGSVAAEVTTFRPLFPGSDELEQTWKVLEMLGTPSSNNGFENYYPSYGYWEEARYLFSQLGLSLPQKKCVDISAIITNPELMPLCDVIRTCLVWDPNVRADVEKLCRMPYFVGTCVDDYSDRSSSANLKVSKSTFSNGNYQKSEKFAGIPARKVALPLKDEVNIYHDTAIATVGSSPTNTDVTFSFLKDLDKPLIKPVADEPPTSFQRAMIDASSETPNLTQTTAESFQTNDENLNFQNGAFHTSYLQGNQRVFRDGLKLIQTPNAPQKIPSLIDFNQNDHSPTFSNLSKVMYDQNYFNEEPFANYVYDQQDQDTNGIDSNADFDALLAQDKMSSIDEMPRTIPACQSMKHIVERDLLNSDQAASSDDTDEALEKLFGKTVYLNSDEEHSTQVDDSEFSTELYSKFNLRQEAHASPYLHELESFDVQ
jgi:serine/threonine protein kinase